MQLLRITSMPMKYQLSVERARLEFSAEKPRAQISKSGGTWEMSQQTPQVRVDTFERRSSMGLKSVRGSNQEFAQIGERAATEATGNYVDFGNEIIHIERGASIPDTAFSQYFQRATGGELVFVPVSPSEISWTEGGVQTNYTPVQLDFNWQGTAGRTPMEFVPGGVSMNIEQYPKVQIEYLGKPIYVPASAAEKFEALA